MQFQSPSSGRFSPLKIHLQDEWLFRFTDCSGLSKETSRPSLTRVSLNIGFLFFMYVFHQGSAALVFLERPTSAVWGQGAPWHLISPLLVSGFYLLQSAPSWRGE